MLSAVLLLQRSDSTRLLKKPP